MGVAQWQRFFPRGITTRRRYVSCCCCCCCCCSCCCCSFVHSRHTSRGGGVGFRPPVNSLRWAGVDPANDKQTVGLYWHRHARPLDEFMKAMCVGLQPYGDIEGVDSRSSRNNAQQHGSGVHHAFCLTPLHTRALLPAMATASGLDQMEFTGQQHVGSEKCASWTPFLRPVRKLNPFAATSKPVTMSY